MVWKLKSESDVQDLLTLEKVLLANRGVSDAEAFFHPAHPSQLTLQDVAIDQKQVDASLARLKTALAQHEDILVFGDYDADGISATAVMWLTLHELGFAARPFIPHREKHGYGLSKKALDEILAGTKPQIIVTVDNGIVALEQVKFLQEQGIDVIITDHHQPEKDATGWILPEALAVVHTTKLCGTTVAWMLAREIARSLGQPELVNRHLDLCGLATIADQVPLLNANRSFAAHGITVLQETLRPGIKALCQLAGIEQPKLSVGTVNYTLAPRVNAMGRLDHGLDALRLLCTSNQARATQLASTLSSTNTRRQTLTDDLLKTALQEADSWQDEHLIVVYSPSFHEGVIGLVAGRLMELYHKPAIVLVAGEKTAKASARSIPGVNIVELIRKVRDDLLEVGGHPMAAGFGLETSNLEVVKQRLLTLAKTEIDATLLQPSIELECLLPFTLIGTKLVKVLEKFAPFGQGNHTPVFGIPNVKVVDLQKMGKELQHLKLAVCENHEAAVTTVEAVGWNFSRKTTLSLNDCVDIAASVETNEWRGKTKIQLVIKDLKTASL